MTKESIALHLIKEDLKYHQMVGHLVRVELHIEFFPDLASAVQQLLHPNLDLEAEEQWVNRYVREMAKAQKINWKDEQALDVEARVILEILKP